MRDADIERRTRSRLILAILLIPCLASWSHSVSQDDTEFLKKLRAGPHNGPSVIERSRVRRKDKKGIDREIEESRSRSGVVAKSKRGALVAEDVVEFVVPTSPDEAGKFEGSDMATIGSQGAVEYYDESGVLKWRKGLSPKKGAMYPRRISDGGEIASVVEGCEANCHDLSLPNNQLVVWDSAGNELIRFPKSNDDCDVSSTGHWVSSNGDYVITSCTGKGRMPTSVVIDVKAKKIWRSPTLLNVIVSKPLGPTRVLVQATDEKLKKKTVELNLEQLVWEPLE